MKQSSVRHWLLWFDDAERKCEVFTDEHAARQRHKECSQSWSCTLFAEDHMDGNHMTTEIHMTIEEMEAEIAALEKLIEPANQRLRTLKQELLEARSPIKVGDIIEFNQAYGHLRYGRVLRIDEWVGNQPEYIIVNIRADGSDGARGSVCLHQNPKLAVNPPKPSDVPKAARRKK